MTKELPDQPPVSQPNSKEIPNEAQASGRKFSRGWGRGAGVKTTIILLILLVLTLGGAQVA